MYLSGPSVSQFNAVFLKFNFVFSSPVISSFSQMFKLDGDLRVNEKWSYLWQRNMKRRHIPTAPCATVSSRSFIAYQPHTLCLFQPTGKFSTEIPANQVQWPFSIQPIRSSAWRVIEFQVKQICLPWSWVLLMRFWINRPTKVWCCVSCNRIQHPKWPLIECISNNRIFTCSFF